MSDHKNLKLSVEFSELDRVADLIQKFKTDKNAIVIGKIHDETDQDSMILEKDTSTGIPDTDFKRFLGCGG